MSKQMTASITKTSRAKAIKPDLKPETREEWIARHAAKLAARRAELAALGLTAHDLAPRPEGTRWAEVTLTPPVAELRPEAGAQGARIELAQDPILAPVPSVPAITPYKLTRVVETPRYTHRNGNIARARALLQTHGLLTIPELAQLLGRDEQYTRTVTLRLVRRGLAVELPEKKISKITGRALLVFAATEEDPYVPMTMTPAAAQRTKARP